MKSQRSIVIPAFHEANLINDSLDRLRTYLQEKSWLDDTEVIVVTAEADDGTPNLVSKSILQFPQHRHIRPGPRVGKGRDVMVGLQAATTDAVLFMDADLATPLHHLETMFNALNLQEGTVVIGVRSLKTMHKAFMRKITSQLSNLLVRSLISWDISDSQCGFKGFDKKALTIILPRTKIKGWGFDFEYIKIAKLHGLHVNTIAIDDWTDPKPDGEGLSGDSQLSAMISTMKELFNVKELQMKGKYK